MSAWIDISVPLHSRMVHWPGDPPVHIERTTSMDDGAELNVSMLEMPAHTGTHMDAPLHFVRDASGIDSMPLDATIGPARVILIEGDTISAVSLERAGIERDERVLFKTSNSVQGLLKSRCFRKNYVSVDISGARYLADRGVRTVGVDYLSVGAYEGDGAETHRILLSAGAWIIEGLDLGSVQPGHYELVCLPLKIRDGDGAPARAVLRSLT